MSACFFARFPRCFCVFYCFSDGFVSEVKLIDWLVVNVMFVCTCRLVQSMTGGSVSVVLTIFQLSTSISRLVRYLSDIDAYSFVKICDGGGLL